jgi:hypothetical protein
MPTPTQAETFEPQRYVVKVGDAECVIRAAAVWPIAEVLELESQFEPGSESIDRGLEPTVVADVLDSRMIAPPRLRRRQRAVSSRAVFYAGVDD